MSKLKPDTLQIEYLLYRWAEGYKSAHLCATRIYLDDGAGEADFAFITRTNLLHVCEVKVSKSDYRADFEKRSHTKKKILPFKQEDIIEKSHWGMWVKKHAHLATDTTYGPSYFWFVTACFDPGEVPAHSGHMQVVHQSELEAFMTGRSRLQTQIVQPHDMEWALVILKQAPRRHANKVKNNAVEQYARHFYHRYWEMKKHLMRRK